MLPDIPQIHNYGISKDFGFLPTEPPLERLPDPYYTKWEAIITNLQALILSRRLRQVAHALPILSTSHLETPAEWRRAYVILAFMTHGYIWGGDVPEEVRYIACSTAVRYDSIADPILAEGPTPNLDPLPPSVRAP